MRVQCTLAAILLLATPLTPAAVITVNTAADPGGVGVCSLRDAILAANSNVASNGCGAGSGTDSIQFAITPLDGTTKTITLATGSPLPLISAPLVIDGYTQNGAAANTAVSGSNAVLRVVVNGVNSGTMDNSNTGLVLLPGASGSTIRGLVIQNFGDGGIQIRGSDSNIVRGNFIGTNATGTGAASNGGNNFAGGIRLQDFGAGSFNSNTIGGTAPADRNLISGNMGAAISVFGDAASTDNSILGNLIGTHKNGLTAIHNNGRGIAIGGALRTTIGSPINANPSGDCSGGCNLISGNFGQIDVGSTATAGGTVIQSNRIGTDVTGNAVLPPSAGLPNRLSGVMVSAALASPGSAGLLIGGDIAAERNIISGNTSNGIDIQNFSGDLPITIQGNYIGTNRSGTAAIPNGNDGIGVANTTGVLIGSTNPDLGNVISGNASHGIHFEGCTGCSVQSNRIGTQADGILPLGNARLGVRISSNGFVSPDNNLIGVAAGQTLGGNTIAFNAENHPGGSGIVVAAGTGNRISGNSLHSNKNVNDNTGLGIDLLGEGPTPNDECDLDAGPNNLQNAPDFVARTVGSVTTVTGVMHSAPLSTYTLQFYASPPQVPSSLAPEGKLFLGETSVNTGAAPGCAVGFTFQTPIAAPAGHVVSALAIDASGNTSEFAGPDGLFADSFE